MRRSQKCCLEKVNEVLLFPELSSLHRSVSNNNHQLSILLLIMIQVGRREKQFQQYQLLSKPRYLHVHITFNILSMVINQIMNQTSNYVHKLVTKQKGTRMHTKSPKDTTTYCCYCVSIGHDISLVYGALRHSSLADPCYMYTL